MHPKQFGFTLIEILIALFIFTIVSIILVTALHNIFNYQAETEKQAERLNKLQFALLFISHDIEQIINRPILNSDGAEEGALIGARQSLVLTHAGFSNPLGTLHRSTLQRSGYVLKDGNLIRETWDSIDQGANAPVHSRKLLDDVTDLQFEYLNDKMKFQTTWRVEGQTQPNTALPRAIRISLTLKKWGKLTQLYLMPGQYLAKPA